METIVATGMSFHKFISRETVFSRNEPADVNKFAVTSPSMRVDWPFSEEENIVYETIKK
jgi:hypothetical protein